MSVIAHQQCSFVQQNMSGREREGGNCEILTGHDANQAGGG